MDIDRQITHYVGDLCEGGHKEPVPDNATDALMAAVERCGQEHGYQSSHRGPWECAEVQRQADLLIAQSKAEMPCLHKLWCLIGRTCDEDHGAVNWHDGGIPCESCKARIQLRQAKTDLAALEERT